MHSFKDTQGREWKLDFTVAELEDLEAAGIPLGTNDEIAAMFDDRAKFLKVLWAMIGEQIAAANLTDRELKQALGGTVWHEARRAVMREILFFTQDLMAEEVNAVLTSTEQMRGRMVGKLVKQMDAGELDGKLESSNTAIDSPGSSA